MACNIAQEGRSANTLIPSLWGNKWGFTLCAQLRSWGSYWICILLSQTTGKIFWLSARSKQKAQRRSLHFSIIQCKNNKSYSTLKKLVLWWFRAENENVTVNEENKKHSWNGCAAKGCAFMILWRHVTIVYLRPWFGRFSAHLKSNCCENWRGFLWKLWVPRKPVSFVFFGIFLSNQHMQLISSVERLKKLLFAG